ncbi:hypothetical protein UlMin_019394 [Ulmus minor]
MYYIIHKKIYVLGHYLSYSNKNLKLNTLKTKDNYILHHKSLNFSNINNLQVGETSQFMQIYQSREVGQSYVTSLWTTKVAMANALWLMIRIRPEVVLGLCVPLCIIAFLFKMVGIRWSFIFYAESIARVRRLSLSGLILYKLHFFNQFFVKWRQLQKKYPRTHYVGCLV